MIDLTVNTSSADFGGKYLFMKSDFNGFTLDVSCGSYRLYVKRSCDKLGFKAIALEFVTCGMDSEPENWDVSTTFDELFRITAYHDGVRHFEMKRDYADYSGYIYYPEWSNICALFDRIKQLEADCCNK